MRQNNISGILVVDKPAETTSARVVARVKALTQVNKAGHTGTLDPFATGVMVCCLGSATRLAQFFLKGDKTYEGVLRLGAATDTQDATGKVIASGSTAAIGRNVLTAAFKSHEGVIQQQPPAYSALKHNGTPLYKLARQGCPVAKAVRKVTIHELRILAIEMPDVRFQVTCSAGTYIRTLCADSGVALGCGGHLRALRRTQSSGFHLDEAVGLDALEELVRQGRLIERIVSPARALRGIPQVIAAPDLVNKIAHGAPLGYADIPLPPQGLAAESDVDNLKVVDADGRLRAVVRFEKSRRCYIYCCVLHY
jgi:tRNA pseudouridine55 synthase